MLDQHPFFLFILVLVIVHVYWLTFYTSKYKKSKYKVLLYFWYSLEYINTNNIKFHGIYQYMIKLKTQN
jgi:hypothetical protein